MDIGSTHSLTASKLRETRIERPVTVSRFPSSALGTRVSMISLGRIQVALHRETAGNADAVTIDWQSAINACRSRTGSVLAQKENGLQSGRGRAGPAPKPSALDHSS